MSAEESKLVTREACGHDIVDSWRKTSEPIWDDIETAQGEWKRLSDMIDAELSRRIEALQLSAPQSPVVPSESELIKVARGSLDDPDGSLQLRVTTKIVKAIHAHLLATGGRESRA